MFNPSHVCVCSSTLAKPEVRKKNAIELRIPLYSKHTFLGGRPAMHSTSTIGESHDETQTPKPAKTELSK